MQHKHTQLKANVVFCNVGYTYKTSEMWSSHGCENVDMLQGCDAMGTAI